MHRDFIFGVVLKTVGRPQIVFGQHFVPLLITKEPKSRKQSLRILGRIKRARESVGLSKSFMRRLNAAHDPRIS